MEENAFDNFNQHGTTGTVYYTTPLAWSHRQTETVGSPWLGIAPVVISGIIVSHDTTTGDTLFATQSSIGTDAWQQSATLFPQPNLTWSFVKVPSAFSSINLSSDEQQLLTVMRDQHYTFGKDVCALVVSGQSDLIQALTALDLKSSLI